LRTGCFPTATKSIDEEKPQLAMDKNIRFLDIKNNQTGMKKTIIQYFEII